MGPVGHDYFLRQFEKVLEILTQDHQVQVGECLHVGNVRSISSNNIVVSRGLHVSQKLISSPQNEHIVFFSDGFSCIHSNQAKLCAVDI